ncbi:hypothetical protein HF086_018234 [Spodoptera exigua]|uniref:Major facilitator superfamily (MFS) profile domain-containing protein n=1 Tax=Spodoptera exigua TaxID=7107 RepID=A0A922MW36_SPOEX|nr:hypothetical protein HF086_018234 [Spodoptera exigua]
MLMTGLILMGMIMHCLVLGYVIPAAQCDLELTSQQKGWLSALPFTAIILTSYFWGWLADTKGRRTAMLGSMFLAVVISAISSFAPNLTSFAVLQFVSAIFMTGPSAVVYTFLGEFHNLRHRDKMVTFGSAFIGIGTVVLPCEVTDYGESSHELEQRESRTNGFYIWFPTILNALGSQDSVNMKICDVIELTRAKAAADTLNSTTIICDDTIYTSTFERSIYVGLVFCSMYLIVAVLVDFVGKKYILVVTLTITGICAISANLVYDQQIAVVLFAIFQMSGACVGLTNAVAVQLFPTKYRGMAVCLSMMSGRTGSMVGSYLIGLFLDINCGAGFYLFGSLLVVNGLTCLTLPNMKKEKVPKTITNETKETQEP